jgi:hypothetical protein
MVYFYTSHHTHHPRHHHHFSWLNTASKCRGLTRPPAAPDAFVVGGCCGVRASGGTTTAAAGDTPVSPGGAAPLPRPGVTSGVLLAWSPATECTASPFLSHIAAQRNREGERERGSPPYRRSICDWVSSGSGGTRALGRGVRAAVAAAAAAAAAGADSPP